MKTTVSPEVEIAALKIAKSRQKEGQTKEQTKLIAQGIQKGIAEYKKQQNIKLRAIDKKRKQALKQRDTQQIDSVEVEALPEKSRVALLPWILLALSWVGFIAYSLWFA